MSRPPSPQPTRSQRFLRWLTTSNWVLVVGLIVLVAILVAMFLRLTTPASGEAGPPAALSVSAWALALADLAASHGGILG
ncbi:MAG: hypothetical protein HPY83_14300 [Anaerolineae bacterium]|nr:hypothetical protein [Anaerolineae bacterium]